MSDPQDLLYTNKFIETDIISQKNLSEQSRYYDRFETYLENNKISGVKSYVDDNLYSDDKVNMDKNLKSKWPTYSNKNQYPLFDSFINDVSVDRYTKEVITKVSINSNNRNISYDLYANNFSIDFTQDFTNIKKIVLNDISIPNCVQTLSKYNNNLSWQYITEDVLTNLDINLFIIPVPNLTKRVLYSSLPYSCLESPNDPNLLVYQTTVVPGYYSITTMNKNIRQSTSTVLHSPNNDMGIMEEPYYSFPQMRDTPTQITMSIEPETSIVKIVNRIEEIRVLAVQTFSAYVTDFSTEDIFYPYSDVQGNLDTNYVYITLNYINGITTNYYPNAGNPFSPSAFPLVITGMTGVIGGIDNSYFNYTIFYDLFIYTKNNLYTEDELNSISTYKFIDTLTITDGTTTQKYLRFGFKLSTGALNGQDYIPNVGNLVVPIVTQNFIFSSSLNKYFLNSIVEYEYIPLYPIIGRSLLFRWIYDKFNENYVNYEVNTPNVKKRSLLNVLGFPIPNQTNNVVCVTTNDGYRFVQTNCQGYLVNKTQLQSFNINTSSVKIAVPSKNINLQY